MVSDDFFNEWARVRFSTSHYCLAFVGSATSKRDYIEYSQYRDSSAAFMHQDVKRKKANAAGPTVLN